MQSSRLMRARLNDRLTRATQFPVTLIVAPAGFGKSVALRDFLLTSRSDALRYDVRREENSLIAFARRLSEALQPVAPGAAESFPAMQQRVMESDDPADAVCDWLAEHLKRTVCTIVIDDLHFAAVDPAAIAFLAALIDRTCERINWILGQPHRCGTPGGNVARVRSVGSADRRERSALHRRGSAGRRRGDRDALRARRSRVAARTY